MTKAAQPEIEIRHFSSSEEIERYIRKLERRIADVEKLKDEGVRIGSQEIRNVEAKIQEDVLQVFGPNSPQAHDHRHHQIWAGPVFFNMDPYEQQSSFEAGIPQTVTLLRGLISRLEEYKEDLESLPESSESFNQTTPVKRHVFIGHGHSLEWLKLRDFIEKQLHLTCIKFNSESTAGVTTQERLQAMLNEASFAFLVMTGEDITGTQEARARLNVVHEVGLFQGKLGFKKAIILLEENCEEFSNIHGLGQIRFAKASIESKYEEIRQVLTREGLL